MTGGNNSKFQAFFFRASSPSFPQPGDGRIQKLEPEISYHQLTGTVIFFPKRL